MDGFCGEFPLGDDIWRRTSCGIIRYKSNLEVASREGTRLNATVKVYCFTFHGRGEGEEEMLRNVSTLLHFGNSVGSRVAGGQADWSPTVTHLRWETVLPSVIAPPPPYFPTTSPFWRAPPLMKTVKGGMNTHTHIKKSKNKKRQRESYLTRISSTSNPLAASVMRIQQWRFSVQSPANSKGVNSLCAGGRKAMLITFGPRA